MQQYIEHPTEEALERFLLRQSSEPELEVVETHMLACESCVERLEGLEMQIAATKLALADFQRNLAEKSISERRSRKAWFGVFGMAFAGAGACLALAVALFAPAQINLAAYRGIESSAVPEWRPLHAHLNATDLADGAVAVQLVNAEGIEFWKGASRVHNEQVDVHLPRMTRSGNYFLRLYEPAKGSAQGDLLREFAFRVK